MGSSARIDSCSSGADGWADGGGVEDQVATPQQETNDNSENNVETKTKAGPCSGLGSIYGQHWSAGPCVRSDVD